MVSSTGKGRLDSGDSDQHLALLMPAGLLEQVSGSQTRLLKPTATLDILAPFLEITS